MWMLACCFQLYGLVESLTAAAHVFVTLGSSLRVKMRSSVRFGTEDLLRFSSRSAPRVATHRCRCPAESVEGRAFGLLVLGSGVARNELNTSGECMHCSISNSHISSDGFSTRSSSDICQHHTCTVVLAVHWIACQCMGSAPQPGMRGLIAEFRRPGGRVFLGQAVIEAYHWGLWQHTVYWQSQLPGTLANRPGKAHIL